MQLIIRGVRYTKTIGMNIQYEYYEQQAKEYLLDKLHITGKEHQLNLDSIAHFNKSLSQQRRATRAKFITRWAPTNLRLFEIKQSSTPYCPLCKEKWKRQSM